MLACKLWLIYRSLVLGNVTLVGLKMPLQVFGQSSAPWTIDNIGLLVLSLDVSPEVVISLCLVSAARAGIHLEGVHFLDVPRQAEGLDGEAADGAHLHLLRFGPVHGLHVPVNALLEQRLSAHITGDSVALDVLHVVLNRFTDHVTLLALGRRPMILILVLLNLFVLAASKITVGTLEHFICLRPHSPFLDRFLVLSLPRTMNSPDMIFESCGYFPHIVTLRTGESILSVDSNHVGVELFHMFETLGTFARALLETLLFQFFADIDKFWFVWFIFRVPVIFELSFHRIIFLIIEVWHLIVSVVSII